MAVEGLSAEQLVGPLSDVGLVQTFLQSEAAQFGVIVAVFLAAGAAFHFFLRHQARRLAKRTKTDVDDKVVRLIDRPVFALIILAGLYSALLSLSVLDPHAGLITNVFFVLAALVAAFMVSRIVDLVAGRAISIKAGTTKAPGLVMKIVNGMIYLVAILVILSYFGIDITAGIAALGVGGIAIGFALQSTLSNFFAGLHIVTDRPVNVGDYVELEGGVEGFVMDVGWRSTKIRTFANNIVVVPNSKLSESVVVNNYMKSREVGVYVDCGVSYQSDLKKVERVTKDVGRKVQKEVEGAVRDHEPYFMYKEFGDSNIEFTVVLRADKLESKFGVKHEFIKRLKDRFDKEGIEISWPVRKLFYGEEPPKKRKK